MGSPSSPNIVTVKVVDGGGVAPIIQTDAWSSVVKTVAVPGTAEQCTALAAPAGQKIVVKAMSGNTELVYIGNSKANAESTSTRVSLAAGQAAELAIENAELVWVDAVVAGEGIEAFVEQE